MKDIEKFITPFIKEQFPSFYSEEGELFIAFVKQYYRWLEENYQEIILETPDNFNIGDTITQDGTEGVIINAYEEFFLVQITSNGKKNRFRCTTSCAELTPATSSSGGTSLVILERSFNFLYHSRRIAEYKDIDNTVDRFILQFKEKYLSDIEFTTASNKELFIKNSLDFYRSKGTERAVDLYFKLVYGFPARVYYPGDDVFRLSDNTYNDQSFLEVFDDPTTNKIFVDQIIVGTISGATAYVERFVRYKRGSRFFSILYLDNVEGNFRTGEQIVTTLLDENFTTKIIGSPSTVTVLSSDPGFAIGDDLEAVNGTGYDARVRVISTETKTGVVDFELLDGGWGYTANAQILASNAIIRTANLSFTNNEYFAQNLFIDTFDTIQQDLVEINIQGDANTVSDFENNTVTVYNGANVDFQGLVVSYGLNTGSTTDGVIIVNYNANIYDANNITGDIYTVGNSAVANVASFSDKTATANVIGQDFTYTIEYSSNNVSTLASGDVIRQDINVGSVDVPYANAVVANTYFVGSNPLTRKYYANIVQNIGMFRNNVSFIRNSDSEEFSINAISNVHFGVIQAVNTFYTGANTYATRTGTYFEYQRQFGYSVAANIIYSTVFTNQETTSQIWNDTLISDVDPTTLLNAGTFDVQYANGGVEKTISSGMSDIINELPHEGNTSGGFANITIGEITGILVKNPGDGYSRDPIYRIYDPTTFNLDLFDYEIEYLVITGNTTSTSPITLNIGEIVTANNGAVARITEYDRADNVFKANRLSTTDFVPGDYIYTDETNRTLIANYVKETRRERYARVGYNAQVQSEALEGTGFITAVDVINSGFGYYDQEQVDFEFGDKSMLGIINLIRQGRKEGSFLNRKGFLSSDKYLHDNDYYQSYSYNVITTLPFAEYKDTLRKILHVAGTKPFGSYFGAARTEIDITTPINFETTTQTVG